MRPLTGPLTQEDLEELELEEIRQEELLEREERERLEHQYHRPRQVRVNRNDRDPNDVW